MNKQLQVLEIQLDRGTSGPKSIFVIEITAKSIKVIHTESTSAVYNRETGTLRGNPEDWFEGSIKCLPELEEFVKSEGRINQGSWVWNGGFKPRCNSKGVVINKNVPVLNMPYKAWFKLMNCQVLKLKS